MQRRLLLCSLFSLSAVLMGCRPSVDSSANPSNLNAIDISGADYGKNFSLYDTDGKLHTLQDYRGKVVLLFFGFTQCPDICPTELSRAAQVRQALQQDADRLQVIFVTLDPQRDTPAVLKTYTTAFDPSFTGLYGDLDTIQKTAKEFRLYYTMVPTGSSYTVDHSAISYLIDPAGKLRRAIRPAASVDEVVNEVRALLKTSAS